MRINKLTASFGKLQNETLRFHDGLNIIYAPNESGKSTWCAFIRAMLYGVDSSERSRAGYLPDKLKYVPWSGAPMEGTMELTADHCDITLTRTTRSKNAPMREFTATYTGSNVPVENMNGSNAGELLTGVTKDVFRRSAFIEQGNVGVTGSPELEKRIAAIVSTGEEQTSYTEADERLRAWQRKRRWNRRGQLPELEGKMDDAKQLLQEMEGSAEELERLDRELKTCQEEAQQLEQAVIEARKRQRREALNRLNQGRSQLHASGEAYDRAIEQLSLRRQELRESSFGRPELSGAGAGGPQGPGKLKELGEPKVSGKQADPRAALLRPGRGLRRRLYRHGAAALHHRGRRPLPGGGAPDDGLQPGAAGGPAGPGAAKADPEKIQGHVLRGDRRRAAQLPCQIRGGAGGGKAGKAGPQRL